MDIRERLRALPTRTLITSVDAGQRGQQSVDVPLELRDEAATLIDRLEEALRDAREGLASVLPLGYPHPLLAKIDAALSQLNCGGSDGR